MQKHQISEVHPVVRCSWPKMTSKARRRPETRTHFLHGAKEGNKNAQRCIEAQFRDKDKSFTAALRNDWELTHLEQSGFSLFIIV